MNAYLLVGGRSSRMGRSKVDLPFGGSTFLARTLDAARSVFHSVYAVQRAGGAEIAAVETIFENHHAEEGPVFGLLRALEHAESLGEERSCILAIDYPLLTQGMLRYLSRRFEASDAPLMVPRWNGRMQMLCAGYATRLAPILAQRIAAGRYDLRGLLDTPGAVAIDEDELRATFPGEPLMNVNTLAELEEARRIDEQG
ncbi:MAG TPA: molybdenum cofactor guanylyltransferase [Thermoanaerobaculia bacterium]|nr:molybdenum cofactor guanylyltransferase [Thermoanaerobaculia bacterium]